MKIISDNILSACLSALILLSGSPAGAAEQPESPLLTFQSASVVRVNPKGLTQFFLVKAPIGLYESDHPALEKNGITPIVHLEASPAIYKGGFALEFDPMTILGFRAGMVWQKYNGKFDGLQSFGSTDVSYSDTSLEALGNDGEALNYATSGKVTTLSATLKMKVGSIALKNKFGATRYDMDLRDGHEHYYDITLDILTENGQWNLHNTTDLVYLHSDSIIMGLRSDLTMPAYSVSGDDAVVPGKTYRVGPSFIYNFDPTDAPGDASNPNRFRNPKLIVMLNWWLEHPYRTGEDVSGGMPMALVVFTFEGDLI